MGDSVDWFRGGVGSVGGLGSRGGWGRLAGVAVECMHGFVDDAQGRRPVVWWWCRWEWVDVVGWVVLRFGWVSEHGV